MVQPPQGQLVDGAVGEVGKRPAHIVQAVVAVHGGHRGQIQAALQDRADHIGLRAVAVDDLKALLGDQLFENTDGLRQLARQYPRGDAERLCLFGKGSLGEADEQGLVCVAQALEQGVHVGLCAAHVAAGDQMNDFHSLYLTV